MEKSGRERVTSAFRKAAHENRAALMPYYPLGFPDQITSLAVIEAIAPLSDCLEIGLPFSDPIADGPTIQASTQAALAQGQTVAKSLEMVAELRNRGVIVPMLFMSYFNPVLSYGEAQFVLDAAGCGADGLIIPDLPMEEAAELADLALRAGLAYAYFLAPTSSAARRDMVIEKALDFIYLVSVVGVTGARPGYPSNLESLVQDIRSRSSVPVAVGFGISSPDQAARLGRYADGLIVGSALIEQVRSSDRPVTAAVNFVRSLLAAVARS